MREIKIKLYAFNELTEDVKNKLRNAYKDTFEVDFVDYDPIYEGFSEAMKEKYGATVSEDDITWSGFWHQGDGLSFTCDFDCSEGSPIHNKLKNMASSTIADIMKTEKLQVISASSVRSSNFYVHEGCVVGEVEVTSTDILPEFTSFCEQVNIHLGVKLTEIIREECKNLYETLQDYYEDHLKDDYINNELNSRGEVYTKTGQYFGNIGG